MVTEEQKKAIEQFMLELYKIMNRCNIFDIFFP